MILRAITTSLVGKWSHVLKKYSKISKLKIAVILKTKKEALIPFFQNILIRTPHSVTLNLEMLITRRLI